MGNISKAEQTFWCSLICTIPIALVVIGSLQISQYAYVKSLPQGVCNVCNSTAIYYDHMFSTTVKIYNVTIMTESKACIDGVLSYPPPYQNLNANSRREAKRRVNEVLTSGKISCYYNVDINTAYDHPPSVGLWVVTVSIIGTFILIWLVLMLCDAAVDFAKTVRDRYASQRNHSVHHGEHGYNNLETIETTEM